MKLGVYSCMTPDLPAEALCPLLRAIGYRHVEWTIGYPKAVWDPTGQWHIRLDHLDHDLPRFKALCTEHDLGIAGLGTIASIYDSGLYPIIFKAAQALGAPGIRLVTQGFKGDTPYKVLLASARAALPQVIEASRRTGVKALVEIHMNTIIPSPSAAWRLVEGFDPAHLGVLFDPGNMVHEGHEKWEMGIDLLGPYLAHVHVKNYGWYRNAEGAWKPEPTALDGGLVDYARVVAALGRAGYDGYLTLEDFRGGYGCAPVGITSRQKLCEDYSYMTALLNCA